MIAPHNASNDEYRFETEPEGPVVLTMTSCRRCGAGCDDPASEQEVSRIMERLPATMFRVENVDVEGCEECRGLTDMDLLVREEYEHMRAHLMGLPFQWRDPEEMAEHERLVARWTELGIWKSEEERRADRLARQREKARNRPAPDRLPVTAGDLPF